MAIFITRVELHFANAQDYESLHVAMERQGFARTIIGSDGNRYQLPTAEYVLSANVRCSDVLSRAQAATATVGKRFGLLVTEGNEIRWVGLPTASRSFAGSS